MIGIRLPHHSQPTPRLQGGSIWDCGTLGAAALVFALPFALGTLVALALAASAALTCASAAAAAFASIVASGARSCFATFASSSAACRLRFSVLSASSSSAADFGGEDDFAFASFLRSSTASCWLAATASLAACRLVAANVASCFAAVSSRFSFFTSGESAASTLMLDTGVAGDWEPPPGVELATARVNQLS